MGFTKPTIKWVSGALSRVGGEGVERPWRAANRLPPFRPGFENAWSHNCTPPYVFKARYLVIHRHNFIFIFNVRSSLPNLTEIHSAVSEIQHADGRSDGIMFSPARVHFYQQI